jgi:hypothetical protein
MAGQEKTRKAKRRIFHKEKDWSEVNYIDKLFSS